MILFSPASEDLSEHLFLVYLLIFIAGIAILVSCTILLWLLGQSGAELYIDLICYFGIYLLACFGVLLIASTFDYPLKEKKLMFVISWQTKDGFFGEEIAETVEEVIQTRDSFKRMGYSVVVLPHEPEEELPMEESIKINEFIAFDWCGWNQQYGRFTHCPSGKTIVCQSWMVQEEWDKAQLEFFKQYPGIKVYNCKHTYSIVGTEVMGTTEEICQRLKSRLKRD